jgi:hypothetical protein
VSLLVVGLSACIPSIVRYVFNMFKKRNDAVQKEGKLVCAGSGSVEVNLISTTSIPDHSSCTRELSIKSLHSTLAF